MIPFSVSRTNLKEIYLIYIYVLISPSAKAYVGQSVDPEKRWNKYYSKLRCQKQKKIYNALVHYGPESFTFFIVDVASTKESANEKERLWINKYDSISNGYNLMDGGRGGGGPGRHSQEGRNNIGKANSNRTKEQWDAIVETRRKNGYIRHSAETNKRNTLSNAKYTYILQSPNGSLIETISIRLLCKQYNLNNGAMAQVACGKKSHHKQWRLIKREPIAQAQQCE